MFQKASGTENNAYSDNPLGHRRVDHPRDGHEEEGEAGDRALLKSNL
jgi:hypothetical protein